MPLSSVYPAVDTQNTEKHIGRHLHCLCQYSSNCLASRDWKHCSIFAVNREVLVPIAKPTGYFVDDPCKTLKKLQNQANEGREEED
ncbi:hypothetical protein V6N13_113977 [Hibiscus sabdariffa]|uniref:Uncharacterized protein n=1 Tax=Hibiscus sabdariffa TaxID=183260 RepID=A0ABR2U153_9ROSI